MRSPQDGIVHELAVYTLGGVIAAGETVMQIVPVNDCLVVEARRRYRPVTCRPTSGASLLGLQSTYDSGNSRADQDCWC
ncbi:HlyD family efflux transporter periplasmic adaptor subunit [Agrobacterium rubi]|uniref:HlyD family efflux transporter periplasmic adaptor subunit n=1 Tax=Agrobacterium rubi TaxID=28099 RepID=UPI00307E08EE